MLTAKSLVKAVLGLVFVAALLYSLYPQATEVETTQVEVGQLNLSVEGEGKTRIHDIYVVSTPIDGRVTRIESEPGDKVVAGKTVIANMYPANPVLLDKRSEVQAKADIDGARAALDLASARVRQAQAQLAFDQSEYQRIKELYDKGTVSQSSLERAQLQLQTLEAELETAVSNQKVTEAQLEAARARLLEPDINSDQREQDAHCHICIYAPVDGTVLRILNKSERIIPVGTPLVEIGNPSDLEVVLELLSTEAVKVEVGDSAIISRWGGKDLKARVRLVEPSGFTKISALGVEEQRVYVILNFIDTAEDWQSLGDAFRVEGSIIIDTLDEHPLVPLTSLFRYQNDWAVFKLVDGHLNRQVVTLAGRNDKMAAVASGIEAGDQILTFSARDYYDGMRVKAGSK